MCIIVNSLICVLCNKVSYSGYLSDTCKQELGVYTIHGSQFDKLFNKQNNK